MPDKSVSKTSALYINMTPKSDTVGSMDVKRDAARYYVCEIFSGSFVMDLKFDLVVTENTN